MSQLYEVTLPSLGDEGDAVSTASVAFWLAGVGATLREGDDLLEVNTDKAAFVVACPKNGVLREMRVHPDDEVRVGDVLAVLEID
ncbi:MAG: hypothetical protein GX580_05830 [Candidatus Hydrogenedens sp.]|nr:hypothetical protein [Candidatus Hydrogenedentota bacterium]NLF57138.1 hypothetical protein [Candidatus Hydrogenedens sp.]